MSATQRLRNAAIAGITYEAYRTGRRAVSYVAKQLQDRFVPTEMPYKRRRIGYGGSRTFRRVRRRRGYYSRRRRGYRRRGKLARRSYRKRTYRIGMPMNMGIAKRHISTLFSANQFDTRTLYSRDLTEIPKTLTNEINERQRDTITVSGFKIQASMRTLLDSTEIAGPLLVHFAVVSNVANIASDCVPAVNVNGVPNDAFFRYHNNNRTIAFTTGLSGISLNTLNINKDNYVVLKRKTYKLATRSVLNSTGENTAGENFHSPCTKNFKWWVPLRRQVRYQEAENFAARGRVFIVWWIELMHGETGGSLPRTGAVNMDMENITYFREVE